MGLIAMSERDLQRIEVLSKVIDGRMTIVSAARVLALSTRQVRRLLERISTGGAASIRHKAIGRPSNNRISDGGRDCAVTLVREHCADFGPTLAAEKLAARDGLRVSRETLRSWMTEAGLWLSRKQRRTFHQPRLRREAAPRADGNRCRHRAVARAVRLMQGIGMIPRQGLVFSSNRQFRRQLDLLHWDFGLNALYTLDAGQMVDLEPAIVVQVGRYHAQQKIAVSRHKMAFDNVWQALHLFRKIIDGLDILPSQPNPGKNR
jgi:hypothetical protein